MPERITSRTTSGTAGATSTSRSVTVPQVKIITMTEDELTAKMEDFRRQILSDIKSLMAELPQSVPAEPTARTGSNWVSAKELAKKYGVCEDTIWKWARAGKIPQPSRIAENGCTRWNLAEVEKQLTRKCA